jgi:hypothetical protein
MPALQLQDSTCENEPALPIAWHITWPAMALARCREQPPASGRKHCGDERSCGKHTVLRKHASLDGAGQRRRTSHQRGPSISATIQSVSRRAGGMMKNTVVAANARSIILAQFLTIA